MEQRGRSGLLIGYSVALLTLSSILVILRLVSRRLSAAKFWWEYVLFDSISPVLDQIFSVETFVGSAKSQDVFRGLMNPCAHKTDG